MVTWLLTAFSSIKKNWYIALGALVTSLFAAVKILAGSNRRLKQQNETIKAEKKHLKQVLRADDEIKEQADIRLVEAVKELKDTGASTRLANPDRWLRKPRKDR